MASLPVPTSKSLTSLFSSMLNKSKKKHGRYGDPARERNSIVPSDAYLFDMGAMTVSSLLGYGGKSARSRAVIYDKWARMESDSIISSALTVQVMSALGGNQTTGDVVFIEAKPAFEKDAKKKKLIEEIKAALEPLLNKVAVPQAYLGAAFGDAYSRVYSDSNGIIDITCDELYRPPLVQPFERGNRTIGYAVFVGERNFEKLDITQLARLKMPRTIWVPQFGVVEKALRSSILEDDINNLPLLPSMVGGSLLYNAEEAYDRLNATIMGLVSERWKASLDHRIVGIQMESMTKDQQNRFKKSVYDMYKQVKDIIANAIKTGTPIMEPIVSLLPMFNEKQLITLNDGNAFQPKITVEDVMFHARMLSGTMGVDLSMLGFADQMPSSLSGDGGMSGIAAQAAEKARLIRMGLTEYCEHIIDIHTFRRYGYVLEPKDKPWDINLYGSIYALEAKQQATRTDAMNSGMLMAQAMQMMKEMGADKEIMETYLSKTMLVDEELSKQYAKIVDLMPKQPPGMPGEGGFGGGDDFGPGGVPQIPTEEKAEQE